jgi:alpha-1,6-mannosyltransferase
MQHRQHSVATSSAGALALASPPPPAAGSSTARGLTFCDVSTFYSPTSGGVRTYYRAKLDWFARQDHHEYVLIHPGPGVQVERIAPRVRVVQVFGVPAYRRTGYRLLVHYPQLQRLVREIKPDVLETGDPWFSGPMGLVLRKRREVGGLVTSFFHTDPLTSYLVPWISKRTLAGNMLMRNVYPRADAIFYRVQRLYDATLVSSRLMEDRLHESGIKRVVRVPFGVDPIFFEAGRGRGGSSDDRERKRGRVKRLLYAGRLHPEKGMDLLLDALPTLLAEPNVHVTVVGTGPYGKEIAAITHPRFHYQGFVDGRAQLAEIYRTHDILLAPGPYETFGLGVLEGLASGLMVVGPDAGGTGELLRELPQPMLFTAHDTGSFLRTIQFALERDPDEEARAGIAIAQAYGTWDEAVERQVRTYETIIAGQKPWLD